MDFKELFNSLMGSFTEAVGTVSEKGQEYAGVAMDKAKSAGKAAKLSLDLASEKEALRKAYAEIGQAFYESGRGSAEGLLAQLCGEVDAVKAKVESMERELAELKAGLTSPIENAEDAAFEKVVEADEAVTEAVTDLGSAVEEKVEEAAEKLEDLADKAKDAAEEAEDIVVEIFEDKDE